RIVFVAPYQDKYTLVGKTEEDFVGNPRDARISDEEMAYLCGAFNAVFENTIAPSDVIFTYSGVRALVDDGYKSARNVTRDYKIYHHKRYDPPFLSVFGGKLTTHRSLAEAVVDRLMRLSGRMTEGWTAKVHLAGGDLGGVDFKAYLSKQALRYPFLPKGLLYRYARAYGSRMDNFLHHTKKISDMGVHHGDDVFQVEIDYLLNHEWAQTTEDIIWRRSKLGLHISNQTLGSIEALLQSRSRVVNDM
ncbi:MAG: hypothetical protein L3J04_09505, partial [Robiginitomaculum sp.]|nr:hypothetical protein [Robiginitomaculum sp.]